jgi:hypothetical protein
MQAAGVDNARRPTAAIAGGAGLESATALLAATAPNMAIAPAMSTLERLMTSEIRHHMPFRHNDDVPELPIPHSLGRSLLGSAAHRREAATRGVEGARETS